MAIELQRVLDAPMAQHLRIRSHELVEDDSPQEGGGDSGPSPHDLYDAQLAELQAVAHKFPVNKLMTTVATEISTVVERHP